MMLSFQDTRVLTTKLVQMLDLGMSVPEIRERLRAGGTDLTPECKEIIQTTVILHTYVRWQAVPGLN